MNKVILVGRLTRDPVKRYTHNNTPVSSFGLAVNRRFRREGDPEADFFEVSCFGNTADFVAKWYAKGKSVTVVGSVHLHTWTDTDEQQHTTMDVHCDDTSFAG